jgi:hypothetical protein
VDSSANGHIRALVHVRLNCPDLEQFVERYAEHLTQRVMFVPSRQAPPVGTTIRLALILRDGEVVFSGEGDVVWVKGVQPAGPKRAPGMGVKFTGVSASSVPVWERMLDRCAQLRRPEPSSSEGEPATARPEVEPPRVVAPKARPTPQPPLAAAPTPQPPLAPAPAARPPRVAAPTPQPPLAAVPKSQPPPAAAPTPPHLPRAAAPTPQTPRAAAPTPQPPPAAPTPQPSLAAAPTPQTPLAAEARDPRPEATPPPVGDRAEPDSLFADELHPRRTVRGLAWTAAVAAAVLTVIGVARPHRAQRAVAVRDDSRVRTEPAVRPAAEVAPPPVTAAPSAAFPAPEPSAPAITAAAPAPSELEPAVPPPRRGSPGLRVERILTGATYARYTCPEPTQHFSLRVHRRVNVCFEIAAMEAPVVEPVTVVWERNGALYGTTEVTIAARHFTLHTRVHMIIDNRRAGDWSVRVLSRKGKELARSAFQVGP